MSPVPSVPSPAGSIEVESFFSRDEVIPLDISDIDSDEDSDSHRLFTTLKDHNYCIGTTVSIGLDHGYYSKAFVGEPELDALRQELKCSKSKIKTLTLKVNRLQKTVDALKAGHLSRRVQDTVIKTRLKGKFSEGQLDMLLSKKPRKFSRKWTQNDYSTAMAVRGISIKAFNFVRKNIVPLPGDSTLNRKFGFIHISHGLIEPAVAYLQQRVPRMAARETLAAIAFDEMNLKNIADIDRYLDMRVGPHKMVQTVLIRGVASAWKFPVYCDFDTAFLQTVMFDIIATMECLGLKVLISTCDQGPKNVGLCGDLGVSVENVFFENPYDSSRKVIFTYDFVHAFKNMRNHLMDDVTVFDDGAIILKSDFEDLLAKVNSEVSCGFKLTEHHLNCQQSDRQNVRLACQLLSGMYI
jgi:hypothetical protein